MPDRIQRRRQAGWRMPENTVYVGRPTRWGNPFQPFSPCSVRVFDLLCIRIGQIGYDEANMKVYFLAGDIQNCIDLYRSYAIAKAYHLSGRDDCDPFREIRGKNLACWCPLDQPCHADVLLELANQ